MLRQFERVYGPPYYSFTYGKVQFVALDSVYREGDNYHGELDERQLAFIENDLAHVPDDDLAIFAMHIPLVEFSYREALFDIVKDRSHLLMDAAHRNSFGKRKRG